MIPRFVPGTLDIMPSSRRRCLRVACLDEPAAERLTNGLLPYTIV